jgi:hypothetical protein
MLQGVEGEPQFVVVDVGQTFELSALYTRLHRSALTPTVASCTFTSFEPVPAGMVRVNWLAGVSHQKTGHLSLRRTLKFQKTEEIIVNKGLHFHSKKAFSLLRYLTLVERHNRSPRCMWSHIQRQLCFAKCAVCVRCDTCDVSDMCDMCDVCDGTKVSNYKHNPTNVHHKC